MKHRRMLLKAGLVASLLAILLTAAAWFFPKQVLTLESGPVKADAMVVLGGGAPERPQRAAELFKAGEAAKIILSGRGDGVPNKMVLEKAGVPGAAIALEDDSRTTFENAKFSIPLLRQMGARRVIIVTSWYHSRRALATFQHLAPDIKFYSRPAYLGYDSKDHRAIREHLRLEYPKLLGYWLWHGVAPF